MTYIKITDSGKLKTSELLQKCKDTFAAYSWYSDEQLDKAFPPPEKETTRYFEKSVEPDQKHLGKSADDCEI